MEFLLASHRVGRIFGINIHIAYSLYIIMGLFALSYAKYGWQPMLAILLLPVFVLLHELGHSLASLKLGVNVRRITLHILGGAAEIYGLIPGPRAEIIIAAMGPAVSFMLAVIFFVLANFTPPYIAILFAFCFWSNLILGLFNLLPIFPMDGGRITLAITILKCGVDKAIRYVRPISLVGVFALGGYGLYSMVQSGGQSGIFLIFIAVYLYFKGGQEMQARQYAASYSAQSDLWMRSSANDNSEPQWLRNAYGQSDNKKSEDKMNVFSRWSLERKRKREQKEQEQQQELNRRVDEVLQKVKDQGIANLSPEEKELLKKASQTYRNQ